MYRRLPQLALRVDRTNELTAAYGSAGPTAAWRALLDDGRRLRRRDRGVADRRRARSGRVLTTRAVCARRGRRGVA